ncbi:hypothetical protein [Pseudogulbenkiania subflava]|uniref:Uncharacterized protein n=1 Tax=Pseudogulbenkiania subflava DSM 22618 TaxID=1123014 RepID=A0A1Y6B7C6_9NEIS|nr:hypothetical protein [Pseudogulbenkiania subflava]SME92322.1 hypothetical protein SAMN02745746_00066 [Pseudogulbenkiania subflava DSM 22618]
MALSRRPLPLFCRLLLALWVFACAAGSIEGCLAEAPSTAGTAVLSADPSDAPAPAQPSHHASCQSFCASLGSATSTSPPPEAAPLPTPLLMLWLLLPVIIAPLCRHGRASRPHQAVWPATLRPPFLLFQRFND